MQIKTEHLILHCDDKKTLVDIRYLNVARNI